MTKLIKLGDMVLNEISRNVDRSANSIHLTFKLTPQYGTVFTKDLSDAQRIYTTVLDNRIGDGLWDTFKDLSREETMVELFNEISYFFATADSGDAEGTAAARASIRFTGVTEQLYTHSKSSPVLANATLELVSL